MNQSFPSCTEWTFDVNYYGTFKECHRNCPNYKPFEASDSEEEELNTTTKKQPQRCVDCENNSDILVPDRVEAKRCNLWCDECENSLLQPFDSINGEEYERNWQSFSEDGGDFYCKLCLRHYFAHDHCRDIVSLDRSLLIPCRFLSKCQFLGYVNQKDKFESQEFRNVNWFMNEPTFGDDEYAHVSYWKCRHCNAVLDTISLT